MSESTAKAACTQVEFDMARKAGLFIGTTADERAIHAFAEAVRMEVLARASDPGTACFDLGCNGCENCIDDEPAEFAASPAPEPLTPAAGVSEERRALQEIEVACRNSPYRAAGVWDQALANLIAQKTRLMSGG